MESSDIFIIGGGINGAAIAADAAGRGLSVTLCEKNDLASGTSSASTKLIHGGLRYLEFYEFNLVKKALREREILLKKAPHLITPLEFILPHDKHLRPIFLMRIGLFLYDQLIRKKSLPRAKYINLKKNIRGDALLPKFSKGFSYYDCFTDDSRLTLLNAIAAQEHGAKILTYHEFISAKKENQQWIISIKDSQNNIKTHYAKILINASGPWINKIQKNISPSKSVLCELVKGSHIVVPKLFSGDFAYVLQNADDRIIFAIPYQEKFTLIGTTDVAFSENLDDLKITAVEENYLCNAINQYFKKSISRSDIVWSYAGVRCLQDGDSQNISKITRDYKLAWDDETNPTLLTVIGGKMTTHRNLAEEAIDKLKIIFPDLKATWTATASLPGGDFPEHDFKKFLSTLKNDFPWLPEKIRIRYAKNYGTRAYLILKNTHSLADLGESFSAEFYEKELTYLIKHEWAKTLDDILWRRTKLGLILDHEAKGKIIRYFNTKNCISENEQI